MQKKKKRTYDVRRIRLTVSYTVQDIAEMFKLHKGAVLIWIKKGLPIIDNKKPYLIYGEELVQYLQIKKAKRKFKCKPDEFFCFKCRHPRQADKNVVTIDFKSKTKVRIIGHCQICKTKIQRVGSAAKLNEYQKIFSVVTLVKQHIFESNLPSVNTNIGKDMKHEQIQLEK